MTPALARDFNVIDSFDTHAKIPEHFANVDAAANASGHIAMISVGWDPGMFSVARLYGESPVLSTQDSTPFPSMRRWKKSVQASSRA